MTQDIIRGHLKKMCISCCWMKCFTYVYVCRNICIVCMCNYIFFVDSVVEILYIFVFCPVVWLFIEKEVLTSLAVTGNAPAPLSALSVYQFALCAFLRLLFTHQDLKSLCLPGRLIIKSLYTALCVFISLKSVSSII